MQGPPCCVNQRGGAFAQGFPLPEATRRRMALLAAQGEPPSRIARLLKVSEGSVSQILGRFRRTGCLEPRARKGGRPRSASAAVALAALLAAPSASAAPRPSAPELRLRLREEGLGSPGDAPLPSVSSIRRLLRSLESGAPVPPRPPPGAGGGGEGDPRPSRRSRTAFSPRQRRALEAAFQLRPYPEASAREQLAQEAGLPLAAVTAWFCNRRARRRREAEAARDSEAPGGGPCASCCSCVPSATLQRTPPTPPLLPPTCPRPDLGLASCAPQ